MVEHLFNDVHLKNYFHSKFVNASWAQPGTPTPQPQRAGRRPTSTPAAPAAPDLDLSKSNVSSTLFTFLTVIFRLMQTTFSLTIC